MRTLLPVLLTAVVAACGAGPHARLSVELMLPSDHDPFVDVEVLRVRVLGDGEVVESKTVAWPSGNLEVPNSVLADQMQIVVEGLGPVDGETGKRPVLSRGRTVPLGLERGEQQTVKMYFGRVGEFGLIGNLNVPRAGHAAALLPDGRVLLAGGYNGPEGDVGSALQSAEVYDPRTGTTQTVGGLQDPNAQQVATVLSDGRILLSGGIQDSEQQTGHLFIFDPEINGFVGLLPTGASPRIHHVAAAVPGGAILAGGGVLDNAGPSLAPLTSDAQTYSIDLGSVAGATPTPRAYGTATSLQDGRVLLFGGLDESLQPVLAEIYDPVEQTSNPLSGVIFTERYDHQAVRLDDGTVLLIGGFNPSPLGAPIDDVDQFNPSDGTFASKAPMALPRARHRAVLLPDGRVLTVGGLGSAAGDDPCDPSAVDQPLSSAELFATSQGSQSVPDCLDKDAGQNRLGRIGHSVTVMPDGNVLIAGGWTNTGADQLGIGASSTLEIYVPE